MRAAVLLIVFFAVIAGSGARAATSVDVELGWNGLVRPGSWHPAVATLRSSEIRPVVLKWYVPQAGRAAMVLRQPATLNRGRQSFRALLPIDADAWATHLRVADAATDETLAVWPNEPTTPTVFAARLVLGDASPKLVAVAGGSADGLDGLGEVSVARVDPTFLPTDAVGYGALDALVLAEADLAGLPFDVQAAIVAWVRGGGTLWLWPGGDPLPPTSPLLDALAESVGRPDRDEPEGWTVGGSTNATGALGDGKIAFFGQPPVAADLPSIAPLTARTGEVVAADAPGGGWLRLWLLASLVVGPLDWIALRLAGDRRRWPRRIAMLGLASLAACAIVGATLAETADEIAVPTTPWWTLDGGTGTGPINDVAVVLTDDGVRRE